MVEQCFKTQNYINIAPFILKYLYIIFCHSTMSKRNSLLLLFGMIVLSLIGFFLIRGNDKTEQIVYEDTLTISKEYLGLRYKTENVLVNAKDYKSYDAWNTDVLSIIQEWEELETKVLKLEENAEKISQETTAFNFSSKAYAYDTREVQAVIESAPAGRTIRTLAKHFGVDVKKAQLILNQSQDMATREAWGEAGDAFEKLENQAIVVKDTCKVAVYVGGVVATGGAAGFVAQATTVVVGVDLALEVTEDGAQIALGDKNKVSSFVKDVRTVTEPIASILTITNISGNLGTALGKFEAVNVGLEEFRASAQEGKVIGIDLNNFKYNPPFQVIKNTKYPGELTIAELEKAEVEEWIKSVNKDYEPMTQEEVKEYITNISQNSGSKEEVVQEDVAKEEGSDDVVEETTPKGEISFSEWDDWGDADSRYKEDLLDKFGNPDVMQTSSGKQVWVYYDIVYYESGNTCSPTYTFYDTDQTATRRCLSMENVESVLNN